MKKIINKMKKILKKDKKIYFLWNNMYKNISKYFLFSGESVMPSRALDCWCSASIHFHVCLSVEILVISSIAFPLPWRNSAMFFTYVCLGLHLYMFLPVFSIHCIISSCFLVSLSYLIVFYMVKFPLWLVLSCVLVHCSEFTFMQNY